MDLNFFEDARAFRKPNIRSWRRCQKEMQIEQELGASFPGLQVLPLKMRDLSLRSFDLKLEEFKREVQERVRRSVKSLEEIRDQPIFRAYRDFFWRVGIDPTKTRPAGEALARRVIGGRDLPKINTLVDSYNMASIETSIAIAAFDSAKICEEHLLMRRAKAGENFLGIGMQTSISLLGVEAVIEDTQSGKLIAVYPYRDSEDSKVTLDTKESLLLMCGVPGVDLDTLARAREMTARYVGVYCLR